MQLHGCCKCWQPAAAGLIILTTLRLHRWLPATRLRERASVTFLRFVLLILLAGGEFADSLSLMSKEAPKIRKDAAGVPQIFRNLRIMVHTEVFPLTAERFHAFNVACMVFPYAPELRRGTCGHMCCVHM